MIYINCSVCKSSYFLYNSKTWTLHLKSSSSYVHIILLLGGISEHFIWQVDLVGHFIWKLDLILLSVYVILSLGGYIWALHLTSWPTLELHLKTWPNSAVHFEWALIDNIDEWRFHLLSLTVLCGGYIWQLIWALHLKIWAHFRIYSCFTEVFSMKDQ